MLLTTRLKQTRLSASGEVPQWRLTVTRRSGPTRVFELPPGSVLRVGSSRANEPMLDDPTVSRNHAELTAEAAGLRLGDLSQNQWHLARQRTRLRGALLGTSSPRCSNMNGNNRQSRARPLIREAADEETPARRAYREAQMKLLLGPAGKHSWFAVQTCMFGPHTHPPVGLQRLLR